MPPGPSLANDGANGLATRSHRQCYLYRKQVQKSIAFYAIYASPFPVRPVSTFMLRREFVERERIGNDDREEGFHLMSRLTRRCSIA
jgi:hypothetical protein